MPEHAYTPTQSRDCESCQERIADLRHRLKVNVDALRVITDLLAELTDDHDDASGTNVS